MKKIYNNYKLFIIFAIVLSICFGLFCEIYKNRLVIKKNDIYNPKIVEIHDIKEKNGKYITTSKNAYILISTDDKIKYVNKISFNYRTKENFDWKINFNLLDGTKVEISEKSSYLINTATKNVFNNTNNIKMKFKKKGIEISNIKVNNKIDFKVTRFIVSTVSILFILLMFRFHTIIFKKLEKTYLIISIVAGLLMIISTPKIIGYSYDDNSHLKNSYSFISSESFKASKAYSINESLGLTSMKYFTTYEEQILLYKYLNKVGKENINIKLDDYSSKYNKLVYLPFYLGLKLGQILDLNYTTSLLLSRIFNYIIYVIIMYYSIKICTYAKDILFVLSISATRIYYGLQFSYDPTIIAALFLAFSMFLEIIKQDKINYKLILIFILSVIWASLPKAIYAPYLLLLIFIPKRKFDNEKQCYKFRLSIIIMTCLLLSTFMLPIILGTATADYRGGNVSVMGQLSNIISNKLNFIIMMTNYLIFKIPDMFLGSFQFFGTGYIHTSLVDVTGTLYYIYLISILYITFTKKVSKKDLNNKYKMLYLLLILVFALGIPFTMYLVYSPVGSIEIGGVQQRYFYQLLLPLFIILIPTTKSKNIKINIDNILVFMLPIIVLLFTIYTICCNTVGI